MPAADRPVLEPVPAERRRRSPADPPDPLHPHNEARRSRPASSVDPPSPAVDHRAGTGCPADSAHPVGNHLVGSHRAPSSGHRAASPAGPPSDRLPTADPPSPAAPVGPVQVLVLTPGQGQTSLAALDHHPASAGIRLGTRADRSLVGPGSRSLGTRAGGRSRIRQVAGRTGSALAADTGDLRRGSRAADRTGRVPVQGRTRRHDNRKVQIRPGLDGLPGRIRQARNQGRSRVAGRNRLARTVRAEPALRARALGRTHCQVDSRCRPDGNQGRAVVRYLARSQRLAQTDPGSRCLAAGNHGRLAAAGMSPWAGSRP
jgi:hypothetical protein